MNSYSYNPNKKFQSKEKKSHSKFFLWLFFFIILIGGVGGYVIFSPKWQVSNIEIEGCKAVKKQNLLQELEQFFTGKQLFVFPESSLIVLNKAELSGLLIDKFPRIKTIGINKEIPNRLKITVEEKKPVAVWCGSTEIEVIETTTTDEIIISDLVDGENGIVQHKKYIYELDPNNCFYIDEIGAVFEQISDVELGLLDKNIVKIQQWKTDSIEIKKDNLEISFLDFAKVVKSELKEVLNINVDKFIIPNPLAKELYAVMPQGWEIYFSMEGDALKQIEILKVVLDKKIPALEQVKLDYIDLRVGEKVFYKFR